MKSAALYPADTVWNMRLAGRCCGRCGIIVCLVSVGDDRTSIRIITRIVTIVQSEQAKQALRIADELSDMILFHKRVRENGNAI